MELLTVIDNKLEVCPYALNIKEFKILWDRDNDKHKSKCVSELTYIFFYANPKSPYRTYDDNERKDKIIETLPVKIKIDDLVEKALSRYGELSKTILSSLLEAAEEGIHKLINYYKNVDIEDDPNLATSLQKNIASIGDVYKGLKQLQQDVENERETMNKVKGGGFINDRENPKSKRGQNI